MTQSIKVLLALIQVLAFSFSSGKMSLERDDLNLEDDIKNDPFVASKDFLNCSHNDDGEKASMMKNLTQMSRLSMGGTLTVQEAFLQQVAHQVVNLVYVSALV